MVDSLAEDGASRHGQDSGAAAERYDFRQPERFDPHAVRSFEAAHEIFTRRLSSAWGGVLRSVVQLQSIAVDQLSYDDYLRAMPSPNLIAVVGLAPLPTPMLLEMNLELAGALLDRLLGGRGATSESGVPRRPTDLESGILADLVTGSLPGLEEMLGAFMPVEGAVLGIEFNPQLLQVAAPSDSVLVLTFGVRVSQGIDAEGLLTLCYPAGALGPLLDRAASQLQDESGAAPDQSWLTALGDGLADVTVDVRVTLDDAQIPAADLAVLQPGDVLRMDHRVDRPVHGRIGDLDILAAYPGRRGRRLAIQVADVLTIPPLNPGAPNEHP